MRILLAGAQQFLGRAVLARLLPAHEILALVQGRPTDLPVPAADMGPMSEDALARYGLGCQSMIHLVGPGSERLERAARRAGIAHIVRVVPWSNTDGPDEDRCTLRVGQLIGPGDPHGVGRSWMRWALTDPSPVPGRAGLVDHRDAVGGIESALWKGQAGALYPLVGANPAWSDLAGRLRACWGKRPPPAEGPEAAPGVDAGEVDLGRVQADLGWWHRDLDRSLAETVAGL